MEHELKKLSSILKEINLTQDERARLRARMATFVMEHPSREHLPVYQQLIEHGIRIVLSAFLFAIFVGGSVSVIADNALPGDPLYSFKVHVNEEVKGAFLTTPAKKAAYQTSRIEERLSEVQTLAESKTLTPAKQETAQKALDSHLTQLSQELGKTDPSAALAVTDSLKATIAAKKNAVDTSADTSLSANEKAEVINTYNTALQSVSNQQVQIISKQVDSITKEVLQTPTPDAVGTITGDTDTTPAEDSSNTPAADPSQTKTDTSTSPSATTTAEDTDATAATPVSP
jgi:hypothetical protein